MFSIWQSVKVTNPQHPHTGRAGTVQGTDPKDPDHVTVRLDASEGVEEVTEQFAVADLAGL